MNFPAVKYVSKIAPHGSRLREKLGKNHVKIQLISDFCSLQANFIRLVQKPIRQNKKENDENSPKN